jgi:hypothetical protein
MNSPHRQKRILEQLDLDMFRQTHDMHSSEDGAEVEITAAQSVDLPFCLHQLNDPAFQALQPEAMCQCNSLALNL